VDEAPVVALLEKLTELDEAKVVAIARTLTQASVFNDIVREQVSEMKIGDRYNDITESFDSIRSDAKRMVEQVDDGKVDTFERISNVWMKVTRGDIASRFDNIKETYLEVAADSRDQIQREEVILEAYQDFRGAIKQSEIFALDILSQAEAHWNESKGALKQANDTVAAYAGEDLAERAKLELARDERMRDLQSSDSAKQRVYKQAITFFGTNESVLTALTASFTGLFGLHESTQTLEAMKEGVSKSLEDLADIGGKVQEAAVRAGYGPTIRADAVKKLVDSVVDFQERSREMFYNNLLNSLF